LDCCLVRQRHCLVAFFFEILLDFQVYVGYISIRSDALMMLIWQGALKMENSWRIEDDVVDFFLIPWKIKIPFS